MLSATVQAESIRHIPPLTARPKTRCCPQATLNGMLTAALFFFISQAKPRSQLSAVRPHPTIFNLYFFFSLMGQFW